MKVFKKTQGGVFMPNIIRDEMEPMRSHADNLIYDSKSAYEKSIKAQGLEIIGKEKITQKERKIDQKKLKKAILKAMCEHGLVGTAALSD